ncbi:MAG: DNA-protecting protein DprA [Planctomycetes bacterium]|nr:DNA-protecting protein DprA [Planctomycetota bacterium]
MQTYLMLALAEGFGPAPIAALLDPDLDPAATIAAPPSVPDVPPRVARRLRHPGLAAQAFALQFAAARHGLQLLTPDDARYPERWRAMPVRPLALFVRGDVAALARRPAATLVGSRTPTPYGAEAAQAIAVSLARAGVTLWSGLARGIDGAAHRASVAAGAPTVAVLAGGLDRIYPPEHEALAEEIVAGGGCLLSELPPGHRALRGHFPRRNRLLAAGTGATIVVEASLTSGALQTARLAAEAGADVYALPGPWRSERSQGCHRLLNEGASVVESPEMLLRDLGVAAANSAGAARQLARCADQEAIVRQLRAGPRPSDVVQRECGLPRDEFLRTLFALEADGAVARLPGDLLALGARR